MPQLFQLCDTHETTFPVRYPEGVDVIDEGVVTDTDDIPTDTGHPVLSADCPHCVAEEGQPVATSYVVYAE